MSSPDHSNSTSEYQALWDQFAAAHAAQFVGAINAIHDSGVRNLRAIPNGTLPADLAAIVDEQIEANVADLGLMRDQAIKDTLPLLGQTPLLDQAQSNPRLGQTGGNLLSDSSNDLFDF